MNADELRALQAPVKDRYRENPSAAAVTLRVVGRLHPERLTCEIETAAAGRSAAAIEAGLHPAAGGDGRFACSGDLLLESLAACAGVTLCAVATALEIPLQGGTVTAQGDLDFRGTLGVSKEVPAGLQQIRLQFELDTNADPKQLETLLKLTERYCVIFQTLRTPPAVSVSCSRSMSGLQST